MVAAVPAFGVHDAAVRVDRLDPVKLEERKDLVHSHIQDCDPGRRPEGPCRSRNPGRRSLTPNELVNVGVAGCPWRGPAGRLVLAAARLSARPPVSLSCNSLIAFHGNLVHNADNARPSGGRSAVARLQRERFPCRFPVSGPKRDRFAPDCQHWRAVMCVLAALVTLGKRPTPLLPSSSLRGRRRSWKACTLCSAFCLVLTLSQSAVSTIRPRRVRHLRARARRVSPVAMSMTRPPSRRCSRQPSTTLVAATQVA